MTSFLATKDKFKYVLNAKIHKFCETKIETINKEISLMEKFGDWIGNTCTKFLLRTTIKSGC